MPLTLKYVSNHYAENYACYRIRTVQAVDLNKTFKAYIHSAFRIVFSHGLLLAEAFLHSVLKACNFLLMKLAIKIKF